jgi:hypothetical protein
MVFTLGSGDSATVIRKLTVPWAAFNGVAGAALDDRGRLYLADHDSSIIRVYGRGASGHAMPTRTIAGPHTRLSGPTGLAIDRRGRLYVANDPLRGGGGAVRVYAPGAEGEALPVRTITGSATGLSQPPDVAFDQRGEMYIPTTSNNNPGTIAVFRAEAHGNDAPIRTISGPNTLLRLPTKLVFGPGDTLYALNIFGWPRGHCSFAPPANVTVTAYARDMKGNVEPVRTLIVTREGKSAGREHGISGIRGMQVDATGRVHLWDGSGEMVFGRRASGFAPPVRGSVAPVRGDASWFPLTDASAIAVDRDGSIYAPTAPAATFCL